MLEISGLSGGYGEVDILNGVSVSVGAGEVVTIVGTNGSGKSTLGKAIANLLPRRKGAITFCGDDIWTVPASSLLDRGLCYVPQVANVFPSLTVFENLKVVRASGRDERIEKVLARFPALAQRRNGLAGTLSGGERQQLAISRALVAGAKLMVLDEPTANLAPKVVEQVLELISNLPADSVSVLLIEQRAREAFEVSTRAYVMHLGKIVAQGTPAELSRNGALDEMFFGMIEGSDSPGR